VYFTPETYTGVLLRRSPVGTTLSNWVMMEMVPMRAMLSDPYTSQGAPGELRLEAVSFETAGTGAELVPLAVGLSVTLGFVGAAG
jgi:hypothetical protein